MNTKKIITGFTLLSCIFGFSQAIEADVQRVRNGLSIYNGEINSGTARYIGMGSSMGALGGDLSSINTNPASSAVYIKSSFGLTLGVDNTKNKAAFGSSLSTNNSNFNFNQGGLVFVVDLNDKNFKNLSFAITGTNENIDDEILFPNNSNITFDDNSTPVNTYTFNGFRDYRNGEKAKVNFNVGTNYNDKLYLGLNLNYHYANYDHSIRYSEIDQNNNTYVYNKENTPYSETSNGFSLGLGVISKINQNIRLGLAYNSPVWWNNIQTEFISYDVDNGYTDLYFFDQDRVTGAGRLTASGAFVMENLAVNVDYNYNLNSDTQIRPKSEFLGENDFIDAYVKNTSEIKIGAEYRIKNLRLRGGWGTLESPMKDVSYTTGTVNELGVTSNNNVKDLFLGKRDQFSLGLGYNFGNFFMDFAFQNTKQDYNYIMNGFFIDNEYFTIDLTSNLLGEVTKTTNNYFLTFGWNF